MKTGYKDRNGIDICENDIISVSGRFGWVFKYDDYVNPDESGWFVAWDVEGPSCEDCTRIDEILKDKYTSIKVIGIIKWKK